MITWNYILNEALKNTCKVLCTIKYLFPNTKIKAIVPISFWKLSWVFFKLQKNFTSQIFRNLLSNDLLKKICVIYVISHSNFTSINPSNTSVVFEATRKIHRIHLKKWLGQNGMALIRVHNPKENSCLKMHPLFWMIIFSLLFFI